jgi:RimJ/RimL family protein N-acetyltransferase
MDSARLLLEFAFGTLGVRRVEARAVGVDGRANGSLLKLGARREGLLREGFRNGDVIHDQVMWSLLANDWRAARAARQDMN